MARRYVREVIVRSEGEPVLVWYWYRVGGVETPSRIRAKLLEVYAFFSRTTVSELIAMSATCGPESCEEAAALLSSFLQASP